MRNSKQMQDALEHMNSLRTPAGENDRLMRVPEGYIVVRDTTESMSTNRLSDKLQYWRAMRPDEWSMDEFIRDAQVLEAKLAKYEAQP